MHEKTILNIAFYRFFEFSNFLSRRRELTELTQGLGLRGKIILSPEGVNGFLAGTREQIDTFRNRMLTDPDLAPLEYKESWTQNQPFRRMLVKIKRELVPLHIDQIRPHINTGKYIKPRELKDWFEQKKDFFLIDTRNDYEFDKGSFENAEDWRLKHFHEFSTRLQKELPRLKKDQKPVVMFCTGGIRCEKATAYAQDLGLNVYQLDGGILKYFEEVGGDHWRGNCFVFDERVSLDPKLQAEVDQPALPLGTSLVSKPFHE